jgi:5-formyltetrahydrofolate cyclo-ligase
MKQSISDADAAAHRERIWAELAKVGKPDSRFHWDFSSFIADFEGSDQCAERVRRLEAYRAGTLLFITPDNSTETLRRQVMADNRPFLMTTYGIGRGFLLLDPASVPPAERSYAATLDGMDQYATALNVSDLRSCPRVGLLVTGGSAVSRNGVRFGKGHGYFDLEWAMLSEIGIVDSDSEIVDVVHDCQLVDETLIGDEHDVPVDWIITPTQTLRVGDPGRTAGRVRWDLLEGSPLLHIPPIQQLLAERSSDQPH